MKEIKLSRGMVAIVGDSDFDSLSKYKWHALNAGSGFYAARSVRIPNRKMVLMHRQIMGLCDSHIQVDHIDGDGLNNLRSNLRCCKNAENSRNKPISKKNKSGFKGVCWSKKLNKWESFIKIDFKTFRLGCFTDIIECALSYDIAANMVHGEFARTNNVQDDTSISCYRKQEIEAIVRKKLDKISCSNQ